jgi:hypothetical protein
MELDLNLIDFVMQNWQPVWWLTPLGEWYIVT